jgi:hypothetical protein
MANEYKKSPELRLVPDGTIDDPATIIETPRIYSGNYNTLILFLVLDYAGTPEELQIELWHTSKSTSEQYKAYNRAIITYNYTDIDPASPVTAEIRLVASENSTLRFSCPTLTAGNVWYFTCYGKLIEETSATDQIAIY